MTPEMGLYISHVRTSAYVEMGLYISHVSTSAYVEMGLYISHVCTCAYVEMVLYISHVRTCAYVEMHTLLNPHITTRVLTQKLSFQKHGTLSHFVTCKPMQRTVTESYPYRANVTQQ